MNIFLHKTQICCSVMANWINSGVVVAGTSGKVYVNILAQVGHITTPTVPANTVISPIYPDENDMNMQITRIEIKKCPECGRAVKSYDCVVPLVQISRATSVGGACNDNSCRFYSNDKCSFMFRSSGCYIEDQAAVDIVSSIEADGATQLYNRLHRSV